MNLLQQIGPVVAKATIEPIYLILHDVASNVPEHVRSLEKRK